MKKVLCISLAIIIVLATIGCSNKEETLSEIDRIAKEVNYSRNELINTILEHGVRTIEIE